MNSNAPEQPSSQRPSNLPLTNARQFIPTVTEDLETDEVFFDTEDAAVAAAGAEKRSFATLDREQRLSSSASLPSNSPQKEKSNHRADSSPCPPPWNITSSASPSPLTDTSIPPPSPRDDHVISKFTFEDQEEERSRSAMEDALQSEKAFMDYVMSLPVLSPEGSSVDLTPTKIKKYSSESVKGKNKVGLDHLDNLCKLMEQLSELKEHNSKLQKKVQYLEDMKNLHEMHKTMSFDIAYDSLNIQSNSRREVDKKTVHIDQPSLSTKRSATSRDCSSYHHSTKSKDSSRHGGGVHKSRTQENISSSQSKSRERSKSVGTNEEYSDSKGKRKFSKWSKVKEALGWDRSPQGQVRYESEFYVNPRETHVDRYRLQTSRILQDDVVNTLQIPVYTEDYDNDVSPGESLAEEIITGKYSSMNQSSLEDMATESRVFSGKTEPCRCSNSSLRKYTLKPTDPKRRKSTPSPTAQKEPHKEDNKDSHDSRNQSLIIDQDPYDVYIKYDREDPKKSAKSPWGRVKTMIQTRRDSIKKKQRGKTSGDASKQDNKNRIEPDPASVVSLEISLASGDEYEPEDQQQPHSISAPTSRECSQRRKISEGAGIAEPHADSPSTVSKKSVDFSSSDMTPGRKQRSKSQQEDYDHERGKKSKPKPLTIVQQSPEEMGQPLGIQRQTSAGTHGDREIRSPRESPPFQRKSRWNKVKKVFTPSKKESEGGRLSMSQSVPSSPASNTEDIAFEYDDLLPYEDETALKFREDGLDRQREDSLPLSLCPSSDILLSDTEPSQVPLSQSASMPMNSLVLELQRNLSEDFNRKMQEWERMKSGGGKPISPSFERKNSGPKDQQQRKSKSEKIKGDRTDKSAKPKVKDLAWLEKELQKVEREKQRLSKEREKYEERASRLERLRHALLNTKPDKKEILVKTSAGEFRFEGISDAFTKKLYEWETKKGVGPELSTIALLDASLQTKPSPVHITPSSAERNVLQKGLSKSEASVMELTHQPSQTSSNSLPSLKHDAAQQTENNCNNNKTQPSRANSEPDLSSFTTQKEALKPQRSQSGDNIPNLIFQSYVHPEVTKLIDSDSGDFDRESKGKPKDELAVLEDNKLTEDNYYTLLEENMFLLEQLKTKEDICRRLETELENLDERVDDMNNRHQQEMERYRDKLWEVHKPGSKPRDLQSSLKLILELKNRIEDLEICSHQLKEDRETLEDSFRYHSEQQAKLTLDLINKIKELQDMSLGCSSADSEGARRRRLPLMRLDDESLARIQALSTQLLQLAQELEETLMDRTRQVCQLRWELLHRDVSAMRLQTELQQQWWQGGKLGVVQQNGQQRSWSSSEGISFLQKQSDETEEMLQERLQRSSTTAYTDSPKMHRGVTELIVTVQKLKMELLKLFFVEPAVSESEEALTRMESLQHKPEVTTESDRYDVTTSGDTGSSPASLDTQSRQSVPDIIPYAPSSIKVRRSSADNISSMSGHEGSESSSLNDSERVAFSLHLPQRTWSRSRDNMSTSSDSSYLEDETFTRVSWVKPRSRADIEVSLNLHQGIGQNEDVVGYTYAGLNKSYNLSSSPSSPEQQLPGASKEFFTLAKPEKLMCCSSASDQRMSESSYGRGITDESESLQCTPGSEIPSSEKSPEDFQAYETGEHEHCSTLTKESSNCCKKSQSYDASTMETDFVSVTESDNSTRQINKGEERLRELCEVASSHDHLKSPSCCSETSNRSDQEGQAKSSNDCDESTTGIGKYIKGNSPIIKARSPRKFKKDSGKDKQCQDNEDVQSDLTPLKSTSAKSDASSKGTTKEGLNVKSLIQKYNQKVIEGSTSPRSVPRHGVLEDRSSESLVSLEISSSSNIPFLAPLSPSTRARYEALHRAKEEFVSKEGPVTLPSLMLPPSPTVKEIKIPQPPQLETSQERPVDLFTPAQPSASVSRAHNEGRYEQEAAKATTDLSPTEEKEKSFLGSSRKPDESLGKCKKVKSDAKTSSGFLNIKIRKGKKKEFSTVGELCRQSLVAAMDSQATSVTSTTNCQSRSPCTSPVCPSSPEAKTKGLTKGKWLPIFKTKS